MKFIVIILIFSIILSGCNSENTAQPNNEVQTEITQNNNTENESRVVEEILEEPKNQEEEIEIEPTEQIKEQNDNEYLAEKEIDLTDMQDTSTEELEQIRKLE